MCSTVCRINVISECQKFLAFYEYFENPLGHLNALVLEFHIPNFEDTKVFLYYFCPQFSCMASLLAIYGDKWSDKKLIKVSSF